MLHGQWDFKSNITNNFSLEYSFAADDGALHYGRKLLETVSLTALEDNLSHEKQTKAELTMMPTKTPNWHKNDL
jgi:hypothetical protein